MFNKSNPPEPLVTEDTRKSASREESAVKQLDPKIGCVNSCEAGENRRPYEPPRSPLEVELADIWSGILGIPDVGVNDNFLLLGGESLLATQVASRIRDRFRVEVQIRSILVGTIADLAAEIADNREVNHVFKDTF